MSQCLQGSYLRRLPGQTGMMTCWTLFKTLLDISRIPGKSSLNCLLQGMGCHLPQV